VYAVKDLASKPGDGRMREETIRWVGKEWIEVIVVD